MPRLSRALACGLCLLLLAPGASPALAQADRPIGTARGAALPAPAPPAAHPPQPAPAPPQAQALGAIDAAELFRLLQQAGFAPRWLGEGRERALFGVIDGAIPFEVLLEDCAGPERACKDLTLHASFDTPVRPSLEVLNRWNREETWAAFAYLREDGAPALLVQHTLAGGVTADHLKLLLSAYASALKGFLGHIEFQPPPDAAGG